MKRLILAVTMAITLAPAAYAGDHAPNLPECQAKAESFVATGAKAFMAELGNRDASFKAEVLEELEANKDLYLIYFRNNCNATVANQKGTYFTAEQKAEMKETDGERWDLLDDPEITAQGFAHHLSSASGAVEGYQMAEAK